MKIITLSWYDNRKSMHGPNTVYGFIAVDNQSAKLMRDEFRSTISECGMEHWTCEQVSTLTRTLENDMEVRFVK